MRQILATLLLGILLFLAHGVESHKGHHQRKHKSKNSSPSSTDIANKSSSVARAKRSPPPPSPKKKKPPPPKKRPPPPPPTKKRPPPPKSTRSPPPPPQDTPSGSPPPEISSPPPPAPSPPVSTGPVFYSYDILQELPHNTSSFTQGLQYEEVCDNGGSCTEIFWESTGLYGRSSVRQVQLSNGKTLRMKDLPDTEFGEGLTKLDSTLYQLTWQSGKTYTYAASNFSDYKTTKTPLNDGWGAANDGTNLIVGDSTPNLYFINPSTMKTVRSITVKDGDRTVKWLNELEYINGIIYANVYTTECIAEIDPSNGKVVGWLYMDGLRQKAIDNTKPGDPVPDVMNGIAWDDKKSKLYLTGKLWPTMFNVKQKAMSNVSEDMKQKIRDKCIVDPDRPL